MEKPTIKELIELGYQNWLDEAEVDIPKMKELVDILEDCEKASSDYQKLTIFSEIQKFLEPEINEEGEEVALLGLDVEDLDMEELYTLMKPLKKYLQDMVKLADECNGKIYKAKSEVEKEGVFAKYAPKLYYQNFVLLPLLKEHIYYINEPENLN